jgi:hypothetical protein
MLVQERLCEDTAIVPKNLAHEVFVISTSYGKHFNSFHKTLKIILNFCMLKWLDQFLVFLSPLAHTRQTNKNKQTKQHETKKEKEKRLRLQVFAIR